MRQVPKIKDCGLSRFVLSLYVSFHQSIFQIIDKIAFLEKVHISETLKNLYQSLIEQLVDNNRQQQARVDTEEQTTSDAERDRLLAYLFFIITNALRSAKADILKAAKQLEIVIRSYRDIASLPLASETSAIRGLIKDLNKEENAEAVSTLSLRPVIDDLEEENETFDTIYKGIVEEEAARARKVSTAELRAQTDDTFNEICELIYASGLITTEPDEVTLITNIINEINGIIDDYKKTYNLSVGHKKKDGSETGGETTEPETPAEEPEGETGETETSAQEPEGEGSDIQFKPIE